MLGYPANGDQEREPCRGLRRRNRDNHPGLLRDWIGCASLDRRSFDEFGIGSSSGGDFGLRRLGDDGSSAQETAKCFDRKWMGLVHCFAGLSHKRFWLRTSTSQLSKTSVRSA